MIPKKGEYWHVQYGIEKKTNIIVLVKEDLQEGRNCIKCDRLGSEVLVDLDCFIERYDV